MLNNRSYNVKSNNDEQAVYVNNRGLMNFESLNSDRANNNSSSKYMLNNCNRHNKIASIINSFHADALLKRFVAVLLALSMIMTFGACGTDNFTSDGTENNSSQDINASDESNGTGSEQSDIEIPVDEDPEVEQIVTVKADADGTPISAKLKSSDDDMETSVDEEKLPFKVNVKYYLEGEEKTPDEMAGVTGNIRIRFDYENDTSSTVNIGGEYVETKVPLAFVTLVTAADDVLYNVKVNSGDVTEVSGNRIIYGYALPGVRDELGLEDAENRLKDVIDSVKDSESSDNSSNDKNEDKDESLPEYVEIEAYAVDFRLDFTATMVTNGLFKDIDKDDLNDLGKSLDDLGEFSDAGDEMLDGIGKLQSGASEFGKGLEKYTEGADKLNDGAEALAEGAGELANGISELDKGTQTLASGAETLDKNGEALKYGASRLKEGLSALNKALEDMGISGSGGSSEGSGSGGKENNADSEAEENSNRSSVIPSEVLESAIQGIASNTAQSVLEELEANEALTDEEKSAIAKAAGEKAAISAQNELMSIIRNLGGTGQDDQAAQDDPGDQNGMNAITGLAALKDAIEALAGGAAQLSEGVHKYTEGVGQLSEGAAGLAEGTSKLSGGANQLSEGASQLAEGTDALSSSGSKLVSGYDSLESGIGSLKKGVSEMNDKIFHKIGSLSEGALPETLNRLKAMRLADRGFTAWDTYDGKEGSIMFILETEEIK